MKKSHLLPFLLRPLACLATLLTPAVAVAGVIFEEQFETPLVVGFDDNTVPGTGVWIGSVGGFGATDRGLYNEAVSWPATQKFDTPYGVQGYMLHYTNSRLTTAQNALGKVLLQGVPYKVSFNAAVEQGSGSSSYLVELVAFDTSHDNAARQSSKPGTVLATAIGTVATSDMSKTGQVTFTANAGNPSLGKEIGLRLVKSSGNVIYDNLRLVSGHDMNPSPASGLVVQSGQIALGWTNHPANTGSDVWVDVWFGTDPGAMAKVVDAGLNLTTATINAPVADTYYWRVDSYLGGSSTGTPLAGDVFHFVIVDTDGDGFTDEYELANTTPPSSTALNPADDLDGDGLTNLDEFNYSTDPNVGDTDGDGLDDGPELAGAGLRPATSPLQVDSDSDGLSDFVESNTGTWVGSSDTGTNPADNDWDKDGIKDGVETNTGTFVSRFNTGTDPYLADTDSDGVGDYYEVNASFTNPFSAADKPPVPYPLPDPDGSAGATNKPVKVYIMAGQSNMVGIGYVGGIADPGSLEAITKVDHKFPNLIDASNNWTLRQDVFYKGVVTATQNPGPLTANQGGGNDRMGPELGFGHIMGWYHDEPVLLLKASQGNRSLGWDFLPPGSSSWDLADGYTYAGYGQSPSKWLVGSPAAAIGWYGGKQYDDCFRNEPAMGPTLAWTSGTSYVNGVQLKHNGVLYISKSAHTSAAGSEPGVGASWSTYWSVYSITNAHDVLANFATLYPQWASQGFEIAGFVWWQGHKDHTDNNYAPRYEANLAKLINVLRSDFSAPNAPVVVGTIGFGGGALSGKTDNFKKVFNAQIAVSDPVKYPAFAGNVTTVNTLPYWRELNESPGTQDFHYNNNAETYTLVGDAMARAMIALEEVGDDTIPPTLGASGIVDDRSGGTVAVNVPVNYTVTFSEDMDSATVGTGDFSNAGTASVSIGSISEVSPGVFTVQVTPTSIGSLQLRVSAGALLTDVAGNALNTTSAIADNTVITVNASAVSVPDVVGQTQAVAEANIEAAGLNVGTVTTQNSSVVPSGAVISQNPPSGTSVAPESSVSMVVSLGSALDSTAPTLVSVNPADGAQGFLLSSNFQMAFDENIVAGNGSLVIRNLTDSTQTVIDIQDSGQVSINGNILAINPSGNLLESKSYAIRVDPGAILDLAGNAYAGIGDDVTWNFSSATGASVVLFTEDFETPNITDYAEGITPPNWTRHANVFGSFLHGLIDKTSEAFFAEDPNNQAYALRYTNSPGITTNKGVIGPLSGGATFSVTFEIQQDLGDTEPISGKQGNYYAAYLVAFADGAIRSDGPIGVSGQTVLGQATGTVPTDGKFHPVTFTFTVDPVAHAALLGQDVGIIFNDMHGTTISTGVIDNVSVSVVHGNSAVAPAVAVLNPADDAADGVSNAPLQATFTKPVVLGAGNITIRNLTDSVDIVIPVGDPRLLTSGYVLSIDSGKDLIAGKDYAVQIDPTAVISYDGVNFAGISNDTTWNFTTISNPLKVALDELRDHINGVATLSAQQIADHRNVIIQYKGYLDFDAQYIADAFDTVASYDAVVGPLWIARGEFDRDKPIGTADPLGDQLDWTIYRLMQSIMDEVYNEESIASHETLLNGLMFASSSDFPGACAPPADPENLHTAIINGSFLDTFGPDDLVHWKFDARKPTGCYLAPGTVATITVPPSLVGQNYKIRVGAQSWDMEERNRRWVRRLDRATLVYDINATTTKVMSPYGGGIYIEVPYGASAGIVNVDIKGAVRSPYFSAKSYDTTTLSEWLNTERNNPAPWADFQTEKFMMQVPSNWIYALNDPVTLMAEWDAAMDGMNELLGFPNDRGKESLYFQVDVITRSSVYAPGYPTVNSQYDPKAARAAYGGYNGSFLVRGPRYAPEYEFHEQGHGYKFPKFDGENESTINIIHPSIMHRKFGYGLDEAHYRSFAKTDFATIDHTAITWMTSFNFSPRKVEMHASEKTYQPKGHAKFMDIVRLFGWQGIQQFWYSINLDKENGDAPPAGDDELAIRLCESVGADLRPLLHFWGIIPDDAAGVEAAINAAGLTPSPEVYRLISHYKTIVPADNAAFQTFAFNWWGRVPRPTADWTESEHGRQWDSTDQATPYGKTLQRPNGEIFDEAASAAVEARVQEIIDLYFPAGDPDPAFVSVPTPNPMAFSELPSPVYAGSVSMSAISAYDLAGPVEYYFENTTTGDNSGWRLNNSWNNLGLSGGASYSFRVKARNSLGNETAWSAVQAGIAGAGSLPAAPPVLKAIGIMDNLGGANAIVNSAVNYTLAFSQDIDASSVTAADFSNAGTSSINIGAISETSPGTFSMNVTPTSTGTLRLQVKAGAVIKDAVGTAMVTSSVIKDDTIIAVVAGVSTNVNVPNVVGLTQTSAEANLESANLVAGAVTFQSSTTVPAGNVIDQNPAGGSSVAPGSAVNLVVSTGSVDATAPVVVSYDPADGAINVPLNSNLSATFNEPIIKGTGNITIRNLTDSTQSVISVTDVSQVSISGSVLIIDPATDFAAGKSYAVRIDVTAIDDASGNSFSGISGDTTWNFATPVSAPLVQLFTENFEAPDVAGYAQGTTPAAWVRASIGYGAVQHGLDDKASGGFSAPDPNHQAYAFRYTNTGITTAAGLLDTLTEGRTYKVTFDVVRDNGMSAGTSYAVELIAFNPGVLRNNCTGSTGGTVLASKTGNAPAGGSFATVSLEFTPGAGSPNIGKDLAVRFKGASVSASIDNVIVEATGLAPVDTTPPTLAGMDIVDDKSGGPVEVNGLVSYTVTFSEDLAEATLDAGDFGNAGTSSVTIGSVVEATPGVVTVEVTPTTVGSLQLQVNAGAVLTDVAGNALDTTGAIVDGDTITVNPPATTVPNVVGLSLAEAGADITVANLVVGDVTEEYNAVVPVGDVISQSPTGGDSTFEGMDIDLVVSLGPPMTTVPNVVGLGQATAAAGIAAANLMIGEITSQYDDTVPEGDVISQSPNGGDSVLEGSDVDLVLSDGPEPDSTAPVIVSVNPADEAGEVAISSNLTVIFDEDITAGSGVITLRNLTDATQTTVNVTDAAQVSVSGSVLTVNPSTDFTGARDYAVQIGAGAILDLSGNAFAGIAGDITWNFTTAAPPVGVVFSDDFEPGTNPFGGTTQNVTSYTLANTSKQANTALWVRAAIGFGGDRNGLIDESENAGANFSDPVGEQAYGFRYTNSGVTTAAGMIGALEPGTTIDVSFDVAVDGFNGGTAYDALLVLFNSGAARNAVQFAEKNTAAVLSRTTGNVAAGGNYHTVTFRYVVGDDVSDNDGEGAGLSTAFLTSLLGKDIALRFDGASNSANIDNVRVSVNGGEPVLVEAPYVLGLTQSAAEADIISSSLEVGKVTNENNAVVPAGNVISQSPPGGSSVEEGSDVDLVVSIGPVMTTVPNVVGLSQASAEFDIVAADLEVGAVTEAFNGTVPAGAVISQDLSSGASVPTGSTVNLLVSLGIDPSPKLIRTTVSSVSNGSWTTVDLGQAYNSPVVIATPIYPTAGLPPVVTRITNVTSTGFDLKIDRADGLTAPVSFDVSIVAVDEGVYTQAVDGVKMEAVKFTSTLTARNGSWIAESRSFQNGYTNPVVVGQVMSANDPKWSVFWSMGNNANNPVSASNLNVGKHVGEDPNFTRANETIGYIVIEAGNGSINGVAYEAALGADTIQGFGNSATPYSYTLSGGLNSASAAAVSTSGMDGSDGGWAVLSGSPSFSATSIGLHVCEDRMKDSEQNHVNEQVGYIVFE